MTALVTGAANGLGRAIVERLLDAGHDVTAIDREENGLNALAVEYKGALTVCLCDLADPEAIARTVSSLREPAFDLVILNAGISATGRFEEIPPDAYKKLIDINLQAPILLTTALSRDNRVNKGGKLVYISSLSHAVGYPGAAVYAATKDALAIYARSIRKPFKKNGVGVLTVFPGPIRTDHAELHAPPGAKASKRMAPDVLAGLVLKAISSRKTELYPGGAAAMGRFFGRLMPGLATSAMKRAIYDKLDGNTY